MTHFTEENMTTLQTSLLLNELCQRGKLNFEYEVSAEYCHSVLLNGVLRGVFPSGNWYARRTALRALTKGMTETQEAAVLWLLAELSEGRLKTT